MFSNLAFQMVVLFHHQFSGFSLSRIKKRALVVMDTLFNIQVISWIDSIPVLGVNSDPTQVKEVLYSL
ncbi:hypothetical protein NC653_028432 [Populus alba x Populus x berolinensis]|uniref:Uncharacterized protein n=1 Tax=Populus alba x Populus x berolinensis TaxID=444605 RepID=A0AAD6M8K2_9ROSI|nr:hypothetical protein NC653_028432 [Populus alba x Populus x berolinensis]